VSGPTNVSTGPVSAPNIAVAPRLIRVGLSHAMRVNQSRRQAVQADTHPLPVAATLVDS